MIRWQVSAVSVVLMPQICRSCSPVTPGSAKQMRAYRRSVDPFRHRIERKPDGALQQTPGAIDDDGRHDEADQPDRATAIRSSQIAIPAATTPAVTSASAAR